MMTVYLGVGLADALKEIEYIRGVHDRFKFLESLYAHHLTAAMQAKGDDEHVMYRKALRSYLTYLVGTSIFVDKSVDYVYMVYVRYFTDFEQIHEYNWRGTCWFTYNPS